MTTKRDVLIALKATAELYGKNMSDTAATMLLNDLRRFTHDQILEALGKCRMELKTFPTVADISSRVSDGRPGVEEAWAMLPRDERDSCVWTSEMSEAFGACRVLIDEGDLVAARMAFKESYSSLLSEARNQGRPVKWSASLGHDKHHRATVLLEAVSRNRLTISEAQAIVPELEQKSLPSSGGMKQIGEIVKKLEAKNGEERIEARGDRNARPDRDQESHVSGVPDGRE